jgi:hypothetical protein
MRFAFYFIYYDFIFGGGLFLICVECMYFLALDPKQMHNMNRICAPSWLNLCSICITLCFLTSKAIPAYSRIWKFVLNRRFVPVGTMFWSLMEPPEDSDHLAYFCYLLLTGGWKCYL